MAEGEETGHLQRKRTESTYNGFRSETDEDLPSASEANGTMKTNKICRAGHSCFSVCIKKSEY